MFDSEYFRTALQADVEAVGGSAVVDVHLQNGQMHRIRSVLAVHSGYATFESYRSRGDDASRRPRWMEPAVAGQASREIERAVVAYEAIVNVVIAPIRPDAAAGIGFRE